MVEVKYIGRLGNNLFQYCLGRIIAEGLGYKLKVDPIPGFPNTNKPVEGLDYSSYASQILTNTSSKFKTLGLILYLFKIILKTII